MAATNDTITDIIAEKRRSAEHIRNNLSTVPFRQWDQQAEIKFLEDEADRLEAAYKREIDELKKQVADLQQQLPKPDPNWRDICAKCFKNGATEPPDCEYYTEDGCMSPIPDQHPLIQVGNAAKLREAITPKSDPDWKDICAKCMEGDVEPRYCEYYGEPNGCNSPIYGEHPSTPNAAAMHACLLKILAEMIDLGGMEAGRKARFSPDAIAEEIRQALSVPPRNCDLPKVVEDPWRAWLDDKSNWDEFGSPKLEIHDWLLAPATEKEGGAK